MSISPTLRGTGTGIVPERRASQRRNMMDRRLVTVNLDNKDAGLMVDISEAGMAVQALARIKQGATTSLHFELPDTGTRIEAKGTVAWVDTTSGRAGICFQNLDEASAACLKEWLGCQVLRNTATASASHPAALPSLVGPDSKVAAIAVLQREITNQGLDRDAALAFILERARGLTRADGAAIVLGDSKLMACRASSGAAPPVGCDLQPDSGLSGECVRTGMTVRCEDTEVDPRVDRDACHSLGLRSAVIVPLFARGNISGLLEVFYASPRGFEGRDVLTLRRMADLISATLCAPVSPQPNSAVAHANTAAPNPPPNPELMRAAPPPPMIPPVPRVASGLDKVVCEVCGHRNPLTVKDCEKCDMPLPGRASQETAIGDSAVEAQQPGAEATPLGPRQATELRRRLVLRLTARTRVLLLIAVLLLLASIWGWRKFKSRRASAAPPPPQQTKTGFPEGLRVNTTSAAEPTTVVLAAGPTSASEPLILFSSAPSSSVPVGRRIGVTTGPKTRPSLITVRDITTMTARSAEKPAATVPAVPRPRPAETQDVVPPPRVETRAGPMVATIPSPPVLTPELSPGAPVAAPVTPSRLLHRIEPVYPKLALASRVQGAVVLKATVLRSGRLGMIQIMSGNDLLVGAAVRAVEQWRYKPMELDGKPVETEVTIKVNFYLGTAR